MVKVFEHAYAVLDESAAQIEEVRTMYTESLQSERLPPRLLPRVKNVLENQRSALDYAAYELCERFGDPTKKPYYPIPRDPAKFESEAKRLLPGVASTRPDLITAIGQRQSNVPGYEWIRLLADHVNPIKHRTLTPQTRTEQRRVTSSSPHGSVSWNPSAVRFGSGVTINGHRVDPSTQMPTGGTVSVEVLVGWNFEDTDIDVLGALTSIQSGAQSLLRELEGLV